MVTTPPSPRRAARARRGPTASASTSKACRRSKRYGQGKKAAPITKATPSTFWPDAWSEAGDQGCDCEWRQGPQQHLRGRHQGHEERRARDAAVRESRLGLPRLRGDHGERRARRKEQTQHQAQVASTPPCLTTRQRLVERQRAASRLTSSPGESGRPTTRSPSGRRHGPLHAALNGAPRVQAIAQLKRSLNGSGRAVVQRLAVRAPT